MLESCKGSATAVTSSCRMLFCKERPEEQEVASGVASRSRLAVAIGGTDALAGHEFSQASPAWAHLNHGGDKRNRCRSITS